jgi:hypothetical protein
MAKFVLEMDVDTHDHSPTAHRAVIGQMLDQVKQAVGGNVATEGDIVRPPGGAAGRSVIGSWRLEP